MTSKSIQKHNSIFTDFRGLKNVDKSAYLTVFGFVNECTKRNKFTIPDPIIHICLLYYLYLMQDLEFSKKYKGTGLTLSECNTKATQTIGGGTHHSVRAKHSICRGIVTKWKLENYIICNGANFFGVISDQEDKPNFNSYPNFTFGLKGCFGIDDMQDCGYYGGKRIRLDWKHPALPVHKKYVLQIIADWREKQCKLSFMYNGKIFKSKTKNYSMLLPELKAEYSWYPCVCPVNKDATCKITYV